MACKNLTWGAESRTTLKVLPICCCRFPAQMRGKWKKDTSDIDLRNRRRQKHHTVCVFSTSVDWKGAVLRGDAQQRGLLWRTSRPLSRLMGVRQGRPLNPKRHVWGVRTQRQIQPSEIPRRGGGGAKTKMIEIFNLGTEKQPEQRWDANQASLWWEGYGWWDPAAGRHRQKQSFCSVIPPFLLHAFYFKYTSKYCLLLFVSDAI